MSTKTKAYLSGFCNPANPTDSHARCDDHPRADGVACTCFCHWETTVTVTETNPADLVGTPGFHDGIPEADYHGHRGSLSVTGAKLLLKAPALFKYRQDNPEHRDVFDFGKAAHAKVLGVGAEIAVHEYDTDKVKSPKATTAWKAEQAEARERDAVLLLPEEYARICEMAAALEQIPLVQELMKDGRPEVSAFCVDEETGVLRRSRFDILDDLIVDYKTAASAEPGAFARSAATYGYHLQHAWYEQIALDLGFQVRGFLFVAQEKTAPYLTSVIELTADAVARGAELNQRALQIFRDCTEAGVWPGYSSDITSVDIPRWAYTDQEFTS